MRKNKQTRKYKFTSRKLSMAETGYSMMKRRKVYRHRQDSMNGPYEIRKTNRIQQIKQVISTCKQSTKPYMKGLVHI